jgi:hypothetical protein
MKIKWKTWRGVAGWLILTGAMLSSGGCLFIAAGAAAGGAATYYYCRGRVCRDYNASFDDTWAAAHTAMTELGLKPESEGRDALEGTIHTRLADGHRVTIDFSSEKNKLPATGPLIRVGIRVHLLPDEDVSHRIHEQIDAHLVHPGAFVGPPVPVPAGLPPAWTPPPKPPETAPPPLLLPQR